MWSSWTTACWIKRVCVVCVMNSVYCGVFLFCTSPQLLPQSVSPLGLYFRFLLRFLRMKFKDPDSMLDRWLLRTRCSMWKETSDIGTFTEIWSSACVGMFLILLWKSEVHVHQVELPACFCHQIAITCTLGIQHLSFLQDDAYITAYGCDSLTVKRWTSVTLFILLQVHFCTF